MLSSRSTKVAFALGAPAAGGDGSFTSSQGRVLAGAPLPAGGFAAEIAVAVITIAMAQESRAVVMIGSSIQRPCHGSGLSLT
jgi:hypothetical protein